MQNSPELQYHISQFLIATVDMPPALRFSRNERLARQQHWADAWRNFGLATTRLTTANSEYVPQWSFCVSGPLYVDKVGAGELRFFRMPSRLRGLSSDGWVLNDLPLFELFACDYDEDLLVLFSR